MAGKKSKKGKRKGAKKGFRVSDDPITARPTSKRQRSGKKKRAIAQGVRMVKGELKDLGITLPARFDLPTALRKSPDHSAGQLADELAMRFGAQQRLESKLDREWLTDQDRAIKKWQRGFVLVSSGSPVAVVCPTHASFKENGQPRVIRGAFTRDGAHWKGLWVALGVVEDRRLSTVRVGTPSPEEPESDEVLMGASDETLLEEGTRRRQLIIDLQNRVDRADYSSALDSSKRLREERSLALPVPAKIETDDLWIRFDPIVSETGAPGVPFHYRTATGSIDGEIYLGSPENPLAVGVGDGPEALWGPAAVVALSAYADLTCLQVDERQGLDRDQQHPASGTGPRRRSSSSGGQRADSEPNRVRSAPSRKSSAIWGESLRIVGRNPLERSSIVVGHIRRLGPGREASAEAARRAREVGITLREGETWVSPHIRGQAEIGELCFEWKRDSTG